MNKRGFNGWIIVWIILVLLIIAVAWFASKIFYTSNPNPSELPKNTSACSCTSNLYNCDDFQTQAEAQSCFESCGGTANDIHGLDGNNDGVVCVGLG